MKAAFFLSFFVISDGCIVINFLLYGKGKYRPHPIYAIYLKLAAHHPKEALDDGNTKSCSLDIVISHFIKPLKGFKKFPQVLLADPDSGILYRHRQDHLSGISFHTVDGKRDTAFLRIFYRIGKQVHDHLGKSHIVSDERTRQRLVHINDKRKSLRVRPLYDGMIQIIDKGGCVVSDRHNLHLAVFDL